jgi:hypothetical protein
VDCGIKEDLIDIKSFQAEPLQNVFLYTEPGSAAISGQHRLDQRLSIEELCTRTDSTSSMGHLSTEDFSTAPLEEELGTGMDWSNNGPQINTAAITLQLQTTNGMPEVNSAASSGVKKRRLSNSRGSELQELEAGSVYYESCDLKGTVS